MKGWIAAALIILPLLITAVVTYWPATPVAVSSVVIPPSDVHSRSGISDLATQVPSLLAERLNEDSKLKVQLAVKNLDAKEVAEFDAVIVTTRTEDAGIFQLNVQAVNPETRREIWSNAYESPRDHFTEMVRVAGDGLRRALN